MRRRGRASLVIRDSAFVALLLLGPLSHEEAQVGLVLMRSKRICLILGHAQFHLTDQRAGRRRGHLFWRLNRRDLYLLRYWFQLRFVETSQVSTFRVNDCHNINKLTWFQYSRDLIAGVYHDGNFRVARRQDLFHGGERRRHDAAYKDRTNYPCGQGDQKREQRCFWHRSTLRRRRTVSIVHFTRLRK